MNPGSEGVIAPLQAGSEAPGAIETRGRRHPLPPLAVGDVQLRSVLDALTERKPYNEAVESIHNRAAVLTPVQGSVPMWSYPSITSGVESRLAERIATRPADSGNIVSYLAVTAPAVLAAVPYSNLPVSGGVASDEPVEPPDYSGCR